MLPIQNAEYYHQMPWCKSWSIGDLVVILKVIYFKVQV
jgi:hypothetical protein